MVNEIILRAYTNLGFHGINAIADIITNNTDLKVSLVDHTHIDEIIYKSAPYNPDECLVSLDNFISNKLNCHYYRISRIFDLNGDVVGRFQSGVIPMRGDQVRILDSDMVKGDTIRLACKIFNTTKFTIPLFIKENQDLIDMEDFLYRLSEFEDNGKRFNYSYLINESVFAKRTSLPKSLYQPINEYINKHYTDL